MTFEISGKKLTASSKWPCSLEAVEPHPLKEAIIFFFNFFDQSNNYLAFTCII